MSSSLLLSAASGVIFGSALTTSGVYSPSVILGQMGLSNFHMLKSFLAASACSALIVVGANRSGYAKLPHRTDSSYGWFMKYDANVIGGLLQGIGMTLTGACSGTVLVQIALGFKSAWNAAAGAVLAGIVFAKIGKNLKRTTATPSSIPPKHTLQEQTGLSTGTIVAIYELLCLAMITVATYVAPTRPYWLSPVVGGLLIGIAQATSVLFTRKTVGVSKAYEDIGEYFWSLVEGRSGPGLSNILFASGVVAGAKVMSQYIPVIAESGPAVSTPAAIVGGFAMIFGARLAGGCTSGHGISGISTMSVSSFVTVASMFAGGIATAFLTR
ncbi:hypothetical protein HRR83_000966 [Exophiala dermatitidis]|nr:hypothetical protein HRR74_000970 [Exophiala dermatitidis]KAJ4528848.1 hypothetical protein HRR73_001471 [Exophiala dermatitidis]KAJ4530239.1 hypothetical protein HRR76_009467 [Exophiala dermatitidis]KAJ4559005.1 hypothetical protein HRR77_000969 [Exophiala dermatitidis]KAJ4580972.1 hypothetical protein HRR79_000030 [Exophiala dermatitidis]